jgi:DNA-binding MarR family transcriptional regulator
LADKYLTDMLIGNSLIFACGRLQKSITNSVMEFNLNFEQAFILRELLFLKDCESINQKALSDTLRLDAVTISRNLTRLEKAGLISRKKKDGFKREKIFLLTSDGKRIAGKANEVICTHFSAAFAHIDEQDRSRLIDALQSIIKQ